MFYQILIALLAGALLLMIVYCVWSRDERLRKGEFVDFHFDSDGMCDYITYCGRKFYPENHLDVDMIF